MLIVEFKHLINHFVFIELATFSGQIIDY